MKIKTSGCPFSHDTSSCHGFTPQEFEWHHGRDENSDIVVYFDYDHTGGFHNNEDKHKFLWICESKSITGQVFDNVLLNSDDFFNCYDAVFVHDREMIKHDDRFTYLPNAANKHWVRNSGVHSKSELVSMISSGKSMCPGHNLRNEIASKHKGAVDLYGRMHNPIDKKEEGLNNYMFSITVENGSYNTYITEKLMDCFATGTIPIYLGSPDVAEHFNEDGIIFLQEDTDINSLTEDLYYSKIDAIRDNYDRCMSTRSADDLIYEEILKIV